MSTPAVSLPGRTRVRLRFSKLGKVRFTSHRDTARIWERALRRISLPLAYTEGFSPRPRVSFGLALSTGHESLGEYLDIEVTPEPSELDLADMVARLSPALPIGFDVQGAAFVVPGGASLQEAVVACDWRVELLDATAEAVEAGVTTLLSSDELLVTRERKGRVVTEDGRSALIDLVPLGPSPSGIELRAELATQPLTLRPSDLLVALTGAIPGSKVGRVCRTHQWLDATEDDRREPLPAPPGLEEWSFAAPLLAPPAPLPMELRAS